MADRSAIEWTDASWNPVVGCSKVSPGCANCYAETLSLRFGWTPKPWLPEHAAENVILKPERLDQPLRWRKPRMVFVNSMSDLFHELIPRDYIDRVFAAMALAPQHIFQVLTKRPERARDYFAVGKTARRVGHRAFALHAYSRIAGQLARGECWPLPNVWLGVSIENARYTYRADVLREIPAAVRFISAEPLLASLFPREFEGDRGWVEMKDELLPAEVRGRRRLNLTGIDWLIVGGESGGRQARPMRSEWAREIRNACLSACRACGGSRYIERSWLEHGSDEPCDCLDRPAFFFKQFGSWQPVTGHLDGLTDLHVLTEAGLEPWQGSTHGASTFWNRQAVDGRGNPIYRYAGAGPKSAGRLLDGREWNEMPKGVRDAETTSTSS